MKSNNADSRSCDNSAVVASKLVHCQQHRPDLTQSDIHHTVDEVGSAVDWSSSKASEVADIVVQNHTGIVW